MTIFVSYTRADETLVRALREDLDRMGHQVWLDHEIHGGELWWREIIRTIQAARVFVFALSQASWKSVPCHAEFDYAQQLGVPVLPVQVGPLDSLRIPIMERQLVDYRERSADAIVALAGALTELTARPRVLPDPMPPPPKVPFEYLYRIAELLGPRPIPPERQEIIIGQLRRHLRTERDEVARADILKLLREFRERGEITNLNTREIDEILANVEPGEGEDLPDGATWLSAADHWEKNPVVIGPPPAPEAVPEAPTDTGATPAWLRNVMAAEPHPTTGQRSKEEEPKTAPPATPQWWQGGHGTPNPSAAEPSTAARPPATAPQPAAPQPAAPRPTAPQPTAPQPTAPHWTAQPPAPAAPQAEPTRGPDHRAEPPAPPPNDRRMGSVGMILGGTAIVFLPPAFAGVPALGGMALLAALTSLVLGVLALRRHEPRARPAVVVASVAVLGVIAYLAIGPVS